MNDHLQQLEPALLWRNFRLFCNTPRPSRHEEQILASIEARVDQAGLEHERDQAGNLLIRKPATPGHENAPRITLQGHVDMVSEAAAGVSHDFAQDPIETFIEDGWLKARGTTLGADNGIGAAAALAILEESELAHGPLEVLLTVSEEVSLVGARHLASDWLQGQFLLNLDTEEAGEVCIGCAGGAGVSTQTQLTEQGLPADHQVWQVTVDGLTGGHSGIDIDTGRANANCLLARSLHQLIPEGLQLVDYAGGRMDNAITRTATATVSLPTTASDRLSQMLATLEHTFRDELAGVDAEVTLTATRASAERGLSATDSRRLVGLLYALPYGIERMSLAAPGVVETSNNLGVIQLHEGELSTQIMVRSLVDSARDSLVERIATLFELAGFPATRGQGYPGWQPQPQSTLLDRFVAVHERQMGSQPRVMVIHAGLECGLIGAKYPAMEMISFGPTIRGAHSPAERVELESVSHFYQLLRATLTDLATAG